MTAPPRLVADSRCDLGEGPVWDERSGELYWVDIERGVLWRHRAVDDAAVSHALAITVGAVALRERGGLVAAVRGGFAELSAEHGGHRMLAHVGHDDPQLRMNDAKCDARGRLWGGLMHERHLPGLGALYRMDPDGAAERVVDGLAVPNGLDWSADEQTMYLVDTRAHKVFAYDFDAGPGRLSARRTFVEVPAGEGLIDGLAVDAAGGVWIALCHGGALRRYAADGTLVQEVAVPVEMPTSCAFGGPRLDQLFITSARTGLGASQLRSQPHAGGVFVHTAAVPGRAANRFAG